MKYPLQSRSPSKDLASESRSKQFECPFKIVKNHRQTVMLRFQRKLKKQRKIDMKKQLQAMLNEEQKARNEWLNKNMLNDEYQWNMIAEDSKISNTYDHSTGGSKELTSKDLVRDYVLSLPIREKKNILINQFDLPISIISH